VNLFSVLMSIVGIAEAILNDWSQIITGQPVTLPPIFTYISGNHIEFSITVKPITIGANTSTPDFFPVLFAIIGIAEGLIQQWQALVSGTPVTLPPVRRYISGHHIEFDVTASKI
jgi:hypothetical protein